MKKLLKANNKHKYAAIGLFAGILISPICLIGGEDIGFLLGLESDVEVGIVGLVLCAIYGMHLDKRVRG